MPRKKLSLPEITNNILTSRIYLEEGTLIVVYNNTKRGVYPNVDFFELVYQGEDLYLNFSIVGTDSSYDEHIDLSAVNNINGVSINAKS